QLAAAAALAGSDQARARPRPPDGRPRARPPVTRQRGRAAPCRAPDPRAPDVGARHREGDQRAARVVPARSRTRSAPPRARARAHHGTQDPRPHPATRPRRHDRDRVLLERGVARAERAPASERITLTTPLADGKPTRFWAVRNPKHSKGSPPWRFSARRTAIGTIAVLLAEKRHGGLPFECFGLRTAQNRVGLPSARGVVKVMRSLAGARSALATPRSSSTRSRSCRRGRVAGCGRGS